MPYTSHGHWYGRGIPTRPTPELVARCSALIGCPTCIAEAGSDRWTQNVWVMRFEGITGAERDSIAEDLQDQGIDAHPQFRDRVRLRGVEMARAEEIAAGLRARGLTITWANYWDALN